jgi:hypothetical protein
MDQAYAYIKWSDENDKVHVASKHILMNQSFDTYAEALKTFNTEGNRLIAFVSKQCEGPLNYETSYKT